MTLDNKRVSCSSDMEIMLLHVVVEIGVAVAAVFMLAGLATVRLSSSLLDLSFLSSFACVRRVFGGIFSTLTLVNGTNGKNGNSPVGTQITRFVTRYNTVHVDLVRTRVGYFLIRKS